MAKRVCSHTNPHAASVGYYGYPISNVNYGAGEGLEPLLRFSIDVVSTTEIPDAGMDWMEFDPNLTELIPDNVPRDSIAIHKLEDYEQLRWDPLDGQNSFQLIDNNTLRVYIVENMDLLLVGDLPSPDINLENPILTPLPDGEMQLDWNSFICIWITHISAAGRYTESRAQSLHQPSSQPRRHLKRIRVERPDG